MVASVRHFGYSRSSGQAPGRDYFHDVTVFSSSTLENSVFKKHRFQIAPLWRAFSNGSVFDDRFGVVVWMIAASGAKQLRFRLRTD